ncbi:ABC transporter permease [Rhodococcus opacus]|nr:ABC transporter permease [Rhodococcus opacus]
MTATALTPPLRRTGSLRLGATMRRVVLAVGLVAVWQAAILVATPSPLLFPSPSDVAQAIGEAFQTGAILDATASTLRILGVGTGLGLVIGLTLATLAVLSQWMDDLLSLVVSIMNPLPSIAILPLAMIWFGLTPTAIVVVILNSTVWPIALNASMGFRMVSTTLQRSARTMGIKGIRMVVQVLFPASLPHLLTGVRIAWAFGWRTVVGAELVFGAAGGTGGLGYFINQARFFLDTDVVFAGLVVISALGLAIEFGFARVERLTIERWGMAKVS